MYLQLHEYFQEVEHQQSLKMHKEINAQNKLKIESFYKEVKELKELVMGKTKETERMNEEVEKMKNECDERIQNVIKKVRPKVKGVLLTTVITNDVGAIWTNRQTDNGLQGRTDKSQMPRWPDKQLSWLRLWYNMYH